MTTEKSCGAVIFNDEDKVLIVKHNAGHWDFPKGHMEAGETETQTAIREVKEETNIDVTLDSDEPFIKVKHYLRDYVLPDNTVNNRLVNTYYFTGYTDSEDIEYFNLTKLEKHDNLRAFFISKEEAVELLTGYNKENRKAEYLALETLKVLENYKK